MILFADVMAHKGFSAASRITGIPKSRISRRMARLEKDLGHQLIHRNSRKFSLTADGDVFLRHCRELRESARAAYDAMAQVHSEPRGTVRLSCPVTIAQSELSRALPRFLAQYPGIRLNVHVLNRPVDPVVEGVDLAIRVRPEIEDSSVLVARKLAVSRSLLAISPTLLDAKHPVREPEDLAGFKTIAMSSASDGEAHWDLEGPNGLRHTHVHQPNYIVDDLQMLIQATCQGSGLAMLPEYLCREELLKGGLVRMLPEWGTPTGILHVVYPARRTLVPAVRHLLDFLEATFLDYAS